MEIRHTVRQFPGGALALILGLAVALAAVLTLAIGGWGLTIAGRSSGGTSHGAPAQPATEGQPSISGSQLPPITLPPPCSGSPSECAS